jgi:hypothetical protein
MVTFIIMFTWSVICISDYKSCLSVVPSRHKNYWKNTTESFYVDMSFTLICIELDTNY